METILFITSCTTTIFGYIVGIYVGRNFKKFTRE